MPRLTTWRKFLLVAGVVGKIYVVILAYKLATHGPNTSAGWAARTQHIYRKTQDVLQAVTDAETGQRGYLITGQTPYLEPYKDAKSQVDAHLKELASLVRDSPEQQDRLVVLQDILNKKFDEMSRTIDIHDNIGSRAAMAIVLTNIGRVRMNKIRTIVTEMQNFEDAKLAKQDKLARLDFCKLMATLGVIVVVNSLWVREDFKDFSRKV